MSNNKRVAKIFKELESKFSQWNDFETTEDTFRGNSINQQGEQIYFVCRLEEDCIHTIVEMWDHIQGYPLLEDYSTFSLIGNNTWDCKDSTTDPQGDQSSIFSRGIINSYLVEYILNSLTVR